MPAARILIVDDNETIRYTLRALLRSRPEWEICGEAIDGVQAVEKALECKPDVVLMDISMPRMDGAEAAARIRADSPETEIILVSQNEPGVGSQQALAVGARHFISKTDLNEQLLPALDRVVKESTRDRIPSLLAAIVDSSDDAIISKNLDGIITTWNKGAERILGYRASEAIGKHITLIIPKDRHDEETHIINRVRQGKPIEHFETVRRRKDGQHIDISLTISPIRNAFGQVIGASKVARDITAQKKMEQLLREHRQRMDLAAHASQIGFWFCDLPFDKLIWDDRVKEHFWLAPDAQVTIQLFYERLHPEDRERTDQAIARSISERSPYEMEYRTVSPAGQVKWVRAIGRAYYDASGEPRRFDGLTLDITETKEAELREKELAAETAAANAKFRAIFEQTTQFAGIMTLDGVLIDANRLSLEACGYFAEQVLGSKFWEAPWWRSFSESQEKIRQAVPKVAAGVPYREMLKYSTADEVGRLVDFALYPIVDESGKVLFLHPTGVDITEVKRTEENYRKLAETLEAEVQARTSELEKRNAEILMQSQLLREFSRRLLQTQDEERRHIARELHDSAGQTLTVLGINLAQFIQKAVRNPELAAAAERIQDSVQQLHREIRTTSYLLHPPLLDESGLASALSWYIQGLGDRSGMEIDLAVPDDFGRLPRDMELVIFRLVQECLTNIHRHANSKTASICVVRKPSEVVVAVQDHGKGMSPERLAEIQSQSSGVGIRGMRERLQQFDGTLDIQSDRSGTRITFAIPVEQRSGHEPTAAVEDSKVAV